jgi:hypothetical protein
MADWVRFFAFFLGRAESEISISSISIPGEPGLRT